MPTNFPVNFFSFLDKNDYVYDHEAVEGSLDDVTGDAFAGELVVWKQNPSEPVLVAQSVSGIFGAIAANYRAGSMDYETAVTLLAALESDLPEHFYEEHADEIEEILKPERYQRFVESNYSFAE
ncbi:hypothetical protein [Selenomonas ruminantium]|uniref:hypothetical protein n=1 Tax=Selenomonas ruminantium TaxID=971 RepID=UPI000479C208|nr:hypothetical protein [Selenomonas ruminantium]